MDPIVVTATVGEEKKNFHFRPMSVIEAGEWGSKMKARVTLYESTQQQRELMDKQPAAERDVDTYLKLTDNETRLMREMADLSKGLTKFCIKPTSEEVVKLLDADLEQGLEVLMAFLNKAFPSESDQKKNPEN